MIKNIHTKIMILFFVLGILGISVLSFFSIMILENAKASITQEELILQFSNQILQIEIVSIVMICIFAMITLLIGYFLTRTVTKPINQLIQSAEKIAGGEEIQIEETGKDVTQVDELVNAFHLMTGELKQNLNEMGKQKKQIETILLHMTDGIIAFDMEGKIIHINPAAINLLALSKEENTFDRIFKKLQIGRASCRERV